MNIGLSNHLIVLRGALVTQSYNDLDIVADPTSINDTTELAVSFVTELVDTTTNGGSGIFTYLWTSSDAAVIVADDPTNPDSTFTVQGPTGTEGPIDYVARWTLDNADISGVTITDTTGNGHAATMVNTPTTGEVGQINEAVSFASASTEYATIVNHTQLRPNVMSLSVWVKTTTAAGDIFQSHSADVFTGGFNAYMVGGLPTILIGDNTGTVTDVNFTVLAAATTINDGNWHHIVFTYDITTIRIYIDGVIDASKAWGEGLVYEATNRIRIGARNVSGTDDFTFNGTLDDIKIFDRAMTAYEIAVMYTLDTGAANTIPTDEVIYLSMDDATVSGATLGNLADPSHPATMQNTPTTGVVGLKGEAISFNAASSETMTIQSLSGYRAANITVAAGVKVASVSSQQFIWEYFHQTGGTVSYGWHLSLTATGTINFSYFNGVDNTAVSVESPLAYDDNIFHIVIVTYDGTDLILTIDNVDVATTASAVAIVYSVPASMTFCQSSTGGLNFNGTLDEIRYFTRAISTNEKTGLFLDVGGVNPITGTINETMTCTVTDTGDNDNTDFVDVPVQVAFVDTVIPMVVTIAPLGISETLDPNEYFEVDHTASVAGGVGPFTYAWTKTADSGGLDILGSATNPLVTLAGQHGIKIATNEVWRCTVTDTGDSNNTAFDDVTRTTIWVLTA